MMWTKLTSIAALFSSAAALTACTTSAGRPIEVKCLPAFEMKGRCAKVPQSVKDANRAAPTIEAEPNAPKRKFKAVPRTNDYGQPL